MCKEGIYDTIKKSYDRVSYGTTRQIEKYGQTKAKCDVLQLKNSFFD